VSLKVVEIVNVFSMMFQFFIQRKDPARNIYYRKRDFRYRTGFPFRNPVSPPPRPARAASRDRIFLIPKNLKVLLRSITVNRRVIDTPNPGLIQLHYSVE
jgi:hypothetical protein